MKARAPRAFTLVEVALVLLILCVLATGLSVPIAAQVAQRRQDDAVRLLDASREAILGFAALHGRLPCPATAAGGTEAFAPGGAAANGRCADFHGGYLPGAALGLAPLDAQGYVIDPWGSPGNRVRYAVAGHLAVGSVANALTRVNGMQSASLSALGAEPHYLFVCSTGAQANGSGCGPAALQLTRRAAFVLVAPGPNGALPPAPGSDEARNADGDAVFVHRDPARNGTDEFDDIVRWVPIHLVASRLLAAGRLP